MPISTAEFLKTRDDFTLRSIIAQGQPNFGMSPFGSAYGGPLDDTSLDALVAYLRSWEQKPPVELPPRWPLLRRRAPGLKSTQAYVRNATARKAKAA